VVKSPRSRVEIGTGSDFDTEVPLMCFLADQISTLAGLSKRLGAPPKSPLRTYFREIVPPFNSDHIRGGGKPALAKKAP